MIDQQSVERAAQRFQLPEGSFERLELRRDRKRRNQRIRAGVVGIAIAVVVGWWGIHTITSTAPKPADPSEKFGIFAPVAGRIVFENDGRVQAVDPDGPVDTEEGSGVADEVVSTLVSLNLQKGAPPGFSEISLFGWSGDGTELLFARIQPYSSEYPFPEAYLYVLHADGSETQLNKDPMSLAEFAAAISPDGSRVAYAADGLWVVDADGGRPVHLADEGHAPTFSPDGTQVAYFIDGNDENQVWVANADGSDAHEVLADDATVLGAATGMQWSPAGGRIALGAGAWKGAEALAIYTFAPDGSDFTRVITGGESPYWSPDGSQIAFTIPCEEQPSASCPKGSILRSQYDAQPELFGGGAAGLAIADADGSNVREFGYATSGPWHPSASTQADETSPTPDESFARADGEVLSFGGVTGFASQEYDRTGDLGAVHPQTGQERVLVADLDKVRYAEWSADGRWVAYERHDGNDIELWVVGASREPRLIATGGYVFADGSVGWTWSATGADLLWARRIGGSDSIDRSKLTLVDVETGETTGLASIEGDVGLEPAWSPDGTRIALASDDGGVYSVDVRSGDPTLLARLPKVDRESLADITWSPDGTHIAVMNDRADGETRLHMMNADGSDVRVVADNYHPLGIAWSPDGTRLAFAKGVPVDGTVEIWVATIDGADPTQIGFVPFAGCTYDYMCGVTWSPDGTQIGFHKDEAEDSVLAADGSGEAELIDHLTYMSWAGGRYGEG